MKHEAIALLRALELAARTSPRLVRLGRDALAFSARRARVARELVRLRIMRLV